ncbi:hypothetical protein GQ464_017185 [Rhodocaloribacter litoris]|uniref:DUF6010 family protein n=1 Tax=Rhodocaloribacter litoris TaxID=2558931 RepID=UPI00141FA5CE|nr:DUF6010 family protein [Rhodocaloribacter litoris]QXD15116.1 hypothetical protein GQ464_017185 [Rhodocaloribacter litoris]
MRPPEFILIDLALGMVLALFTLRTVRRYGQRRERRFFAVALGVAAFLYVVFAMRGGGPSWIGIETAGLVAFGLLAWRGASPRREPARGACWLAAGWLLHVGWDVGLHATGATPFVPPFYPMLCVAYDLIVAAYLLTRRRAWAVPAPASRRAEDGAEG